MNAAQQINRVCRWLFVAAIVWSLACAVSFADDHGVVQGLKPYDKSVDSGAVMTAAIQQADQPLRVPGGIYYHTTTIDDGGASGWAIEAAGIYDWSTPSMVTRLKGTAVFVYIGPADQPAWRLSGAGYRMTGINAWRFTRGQPEWERDPTARSVGIEITRGPERGDAPSAKCALGQLAIGGFERAIHVTGPTNADTIAIDWLHTSCCHTTLACDNQQTTGIDIGLLHVSGPGEVLFDFERGGNLRVGTLMLNPRRLLFRFRRTDSGTCTYTIQNLKVDPNAAGWRILEQDRPGPLNVNIRGMLGRGATLGPNPIAIRPAKLNASMSPYYQHTDIWLWPLGELLPTAPTPAQVLPAPGEDE